MNENYKEDELKETYTYQDWWEGRVFFGPWGQFSVDTYFDANKKIFEDPNFDPTNAHQLKATFKTMPLRIPKEEFEKIIAKQKEIFYQEVEKTLQPMFNDFMKRFTESESKLRLLQIEIETYEKIFFEEKLSITVRTNIHSIDLGNRKLTTIDISRIRELYHERIVNGKKDFTATKSPNCHFGIGSNDFFIIQVEAYAKYFDWLKKNQAQFTIPKIDGEYFSYTIPAVFTGEQPVSKHQLIFTDLQSHPDRTLSISFPDETDLARKFFNHLYQTDALEIEDYLQFHYNQFSGQKEKWIRYFESRWEDWITDYKTQTKRLNPLNQYIGAWLENKKTHTQSNLPMKKNPLEVFEIMMDITTYFTSLRELEEIKKKEDAEKEERNRNSSRSVSPHDFQLWVIGYYQKQAEKIRQEFKRETQEFDNHEKVKTFINQQYGFIKALLKKNTELSKTFSFGDDHKFLRTGLYIGLDALKDFIEEEYETFLDNNDQHKVTLADFEHEILHRFSDLNQNIYFKKHEPDCKHHAHSLKEVEEAKPKKLLDFKKRYQYIVRNWIAYNKDLGNNVSEKEFIKYALNQFDSSIKLDTATGNYVAEDHRMEKFEFAPEFYQLHLVPLLASLKNFLNNRLNQISLSDSPKNPLPLLKWNRKDVHLLEFVTALHFSGAINNDSGNLTRTEAIEFFENLFGIKIKDAESKLSKATDRKKTKHPFLDELVKKFSEYCENKDSLKPSDN